LNGRLGSEIRKAAGLGPSITKQGKKLGFKIRNQLNYWFNPETDVTQITKPESRDKGRIVLLTLRRRLCASESDSIPSTSSKYGS